MRDRSEDAGARIAEQNVQLVRTAIDLFEAGDIAGVASLVDDDVLLTPFENWPEPGPFRGKQAALGQLQRIAQDYDQHGTEDLRIVTADDEWVVLRYAWVIRAAGSGIAGRFDLAVAYRVSQKRLAEIHFRTTEADALRTAGLAP